MSNLFLKMSRRERLYVILGGAVLMVGLVIYPALKASGAHRAEELDRLGAAQALLADYQVLLNSEAAVKEENGQLKQALGTAEGLLFDSVGNAVMTEAMMVKLLNQFGPDLELDVSSSSSSLRDVPGQFNFSLKGEGRYPEILNFLYQLESYRPLIVIDELNLSVKKSPRHRFPPARAPASSPTTPATEPSMNLKMNIHINCREMEEGSK